ncbi:AsmA family protein [Henriciella sp.]|uniref:AsmA family protein n=1 Tax=Henriciella sp. TaxID=1968823 RepID=UPI0026078E81|nr:AsmA family protein [Henriciella sp.]
MKRILISAVTVVGIVLILLAVLPFLIPSSVYRAKIEEAATSALGREVSVGGAARISLLPTISASVENVSVANPEGFEEPYMIEAGVLRGSVRIWPLLSRRVEVSELSFENASVSLLKREDGKVNWEIGTPSTPETKETPDTAGNPFSTTVDRASLSNATLVYADQQTDKRYILSELDAEVTLRDPTKPMTLRANGIFQTERFDFAATVTSPRAYLSQNATSVDIQFGSNLGNLGFEGTLTPQGQMEISGRFQANLPRIGAIPEFLNIQLPVNLEPIGGLRTRGALTGPLTALNVTVDELSVSGDGLNANFDGNVLFGASPEVSGNINLSLRDTHAMSEQLGLGLDSLRPIRQVSLATKLSGPLDALTFKGMDARTSSPTLTASYKGDISLDGEGSIEGDISASTTQLGTLLSHLGGASSEENGLKNASLSGLLNGTLTSPGIKDGVYKLDNTEATGSASIDLGGAVPQIRADLIMSVLDLTPFLGKSKKSTSGEGAWSDAQFDLQGLSLLDADIQIQAETIEIGQIILRQADLDATLSEGRLVADMNQFILFDGDWQGETIIDASGSKPSFAFSLLSDGVQAEQLLQSLAGFDRLSGSGRFSTKLESTGMSIREVVNQLDGRVELSLDDGMLSGINLGQLVRSVSSLKDALSSGDSPITDLANIVSPQAETDFSTFASTLNVQDGAANIERLILTNPVFSVTGDGQIDLGDRTLDMKLTPAVDSSGQGNTSAIQLNGIPVPLRVTGSWGSPRFAPDISGLQSALTKSATDKLRQQLGGNIRTIISGDKEQATETESGPETDQQETQDNKSEMNPTERAVDDMLGSIFGPN